MGAPGSIWSAIARNVVVQELARVRERLEFRLIGYVIMPEHVHLLPSEPPHATPSTVVHDLKLRTSRKLRRRDGCALPFEKQSEALCAFWQARFYDFNVFTEEKKKEKLEYMHGNPVTRQLVSHPKDWPWSSWSNYANSEHGLISVDSL